MRRLALLLLIACPAFATIAQVGATAAAAASGSSPATTSGFDTTGATLLVITVSSLADTTTASVTDSNGNTWNSLPTRLSGGSIYSGMWYAYSKSGGALVVGTGHTASVTGSYATITFSAWSGTLTGATNPYDSTAGNSSGISTTATVQPGSITPSQGGSLVISTGSPSGGTTQTINSPFTFSAVASGTLINCMGFDIQTSAAAANPTWGWGTANASSANIASFKTSSAPPPSVVQRRH